MRTKLTLLYKPLTILAALLTATTVVTAVSIFEHTFPVVTISPNMTTACDTGTLVPIPGTAPVGTGDIRFRCPSGDPAFVVTGGSVDATPTFTLPFTDPNGYTGLWIIKLPVGAGTTCDTMGSEQTRLTSTTLEAIPAGSYHYCAESSADGTVDLPGFNIDWDVA